MSNHLISLVYKRDLGSLPRKALMVLLADKASDDGSGIWASKKTMADELCCSKMTILRTVQSLIDDGLLAEVGQRANSFGFTVEYLLKVTAIEALPIVACHARTQSRRVTGHRELPVTDRYPTGHSLLPHQSQRVTQTIQKPKRNRTSAHARKASVAVAAGGQDEISLPTLALAASATYRETLTGFGGLAAANFIEASAIACGRLGIGQKQWGDSCIALERFRAAICVMIIDRNFHLPSTHRFHVEDPAACLAGMVRRFSGDDGRGVNLQGLIEAAISVGDARGPSESPAQADRRDHRSLGSPV